MVVCAKKNGDPRGTVDFQVETTKSVRSRMKLIVRLYLTFREEYTKQSDVPLGDKLDNAADMYRRETITVLGKAINKSFVIIPKKMKKMLQQGQ